MDDPHRLDAASMSDGDDRKGDSYFAPPIEPCVKCGARITDTMYSSQFDPDARIWITPVCNECALKTT